MSLILKVIYSSHSQGINNLLEKQEMCLLKSQNKGRGCFGTRTDLRDIVTMSLRLDFLICEIEVLILHLTVAMKIKEDNVNNVCGKW